MRKSILCLLLIFPLITFPIQAEEEWIEIHTIYDLLKIDKNLSGNYILMNDLSSSNYYEPIGKEEEVDAYKPFTGVFDGNGHHIKMNITISNKVDNIGTKEAVALFPYNEGTIKNLSVFINASSFCDKEKYYGGLCGYNTGTIINCSNNGPVDHIYHTGDTSAQGTYYVGGIAAYNTGLIEQCYNTGIIQTNKPDTSTDKIAYYIGGIVGYNDGTIRNCYNAGEIYTTSYHGDLNSAYVYYSDTCNKTAGVCGTNNKTIENCYNVGEIKNGFTGYYIDKNQFFEKFPESFQYGVYYENKGTVTNCYSTNITNDNKNIINKIDPANMSKESSFPTFDFENIWIVNHYAEYPYPQLRTNAQDLRERVESVTIHTLPNKLHYFKNFIVDLTGGSLLVKYESGNNEIIAMDQYDELNYDYSLIGTHDVELIYREFSVTFAITHHEEKIQNITNVKIVSLPNRLTTYQGVSFDLSGGMIELVYDDVLSTQLEMSEDMVSNIDCNIVGKQTAMIEFNNHQVSFEVEVLPVTLLNINIASYPIKQKYFINESLDLDGLQVEAIYDKYTTEIDDYCVSDFDSSKMGYQTITISYKDKHTTFTVGVYENVDETTLQAKIDYAQSIDISNKTKDSAAKLLTEIDIAKKLLNEEFISQSDIDKQTKALTNAIYELVDKANVDELQDLMKQVESLNKDDYTTQSYNLVLKIYQDCIKAISNEDISQAEVDRLVILLEYAIDSLELKPPYTINFSDVKTSDWFYKMVLKACEKGFMSKTGKAGNYFEPNANITRGMVATVLYRMAQMPSVTYLDKFKDVKQGLWYSNAIIWTAKNNIVTGRKDGTFAPDMPITRQDLAIMLRNYANFKGIKTDKIANLATFKDEKKITPYAKSAIAWCVEVKLISGSTNEDGIYLNPTNYATRAECAKMFVLLDDVINK